MERQGLSPDAEERIASIFDPSERDVVRRMLVEECGNNLPFCENLDAASLDRCRFAVLKLSSGDMEKLRKAITLAKQDWRDLLVAAGFANDVMAHRKWRPDHKR